MRIHDPKIFAEQLAGQIITLDYKWLITMEGRPRGNPDTTSAHTDPYLSHICEYALHGRPTSVTEFDALFSEINEIIRFHLSRNQKEVGGVDWKYFERVVEVYNIHHPYKQIQL